MRRGDRWQTASALQVGIRHVHMKDLRKVKDRWVPVLPAKAISRSAKFAPCSTRSITNGFLSYEWRRSGIRTSLPPKSPFLISQTGFVVNGSSYLLLTILELIDETFAISHHAFHGDFRVESTQNPSSKACPAKRDVALDTNPQSSFWRSAKPIYAESDKNGQPVADYRTEIRFALDEDRHLLSYLFAPYKDLYLKPSARH